MGPELSFAFWSRVSSLLILIYLRFSQEMKLLKLSALFFCLLAVSQSVFGAEGETTSNDATAAEPESTKAFCDSMPSDKKIAKWATFEGHIENCDNQFCPESNDAKDLSVLTFNIVCLKKACEGTGNRQPAIDKCIANLEMQQKNVLQLKSENYKQQLDKACQCDYGNNKTYNKLVTGNEGDKTSVCEALWVHNCRVPVDGTPCMNTMHIVKNDGYCQNPTEEAAFLIQEKLEFFRILKLCELGVKAMLLDEYIVRPRCLKIHQDQDLLAAKCDAGCYYHPRNGSFNPYRYPEVDDGFYQQIGDYAFAPDDYTEYVSEDAQKAHKETCGYFEVEEGEYKGGWYSDNVFHRGSRNVWQTVQDFCEEYHENEGELPKQLKFTAVTRNVLPTEKLKGAFGKCCPGKGSYATKPEDENYAKDKADNSFKGKDVVDCMFDEGVAIEFGFVPSLVRGSIQRASGKCWELYSTLTPCEDVPEGKGYPDDKKCDASAVIGDEDQMELKADQIEPKEVFWFLKYIPDDKKELKTAVLKACAEGAKMGRTVTAIPGITLGLEAQDYGLLKVPAGFQTFSTLAYHSCAVHASVHYNQYFDLDSAECNTHALLADAQFVEDCE